MTQPLRVILSLSKDGFKKSFLRNRACMNGLVAAGDLHGDEAAALFYVVSMTCFNGHWRANYCGLLNLTWGGFDAAPHDAACAATPARCPAGRSRAATLRRSTSARRLHFRRPAVRRRGRVRRRQISSSDQVTLAEWLAAQPGPTVATNHATPRIVSLYESLAFDVRRVRAPRRVAGDGDRMCVLEILATRIIEIGAHKPRTPICSNVRRHAREPA